ncbi:MAG: STAS domain-containing protein [Clostridia bacterium]|nr:STAS domain-containing protein [Clostridia bacterium]
MRVILNKNGSSLDVKVTERLDTTTAPQLEKELSTQLDGVESLTLDFSELNYVSSAGLRVLLSLQKIMNKQGEMVVRNVNENIMEVFDITGFVDVLNIEQ